MNRKNMLVLVSRALVVSLLMGVGMARAEDVPFSLTTSTAMLTGIAATAALLVGSVIGLSAGMDAWAKIRGFFKRAR